MTDADDAIQQFLQDADTVYDEYDQGYVDADAALDVLQNHIEQLRAAADE